jgi:glycosyltransferase involved in cell wall biosynthesis
LKKVIFTVIDDLTYDQRMQRICTALAQAGYEIVLVGRVKKGVEQIDFPHFKTKKFHLFFNKGKLFYLEYNLRLFVWLLFQRFDIVCGIDLCTILPCFWVAQLRGGKPVVYDAHELFTEVPEVVRRPRIRQFWLRVERYIVPRIRYAYTVSQSVADEFYRRYQVRFDVIRNLPFSIKTIENKVFKHDKNSLNNLNKIILYQGALNEGRGLEAAIEAMTNIDNAVLWLAGEGDLSQQLRGMVTTLGLESKVVFLGFIKPDDLRVLTGQATIGLNLLADTGLSYRYSLANKFLDYIQAGVPQVCINFPEYHRLNAVYNIAVLIDKADAPSLTEALHRLLNDTPLLMSLKNNCQKAAENLCWEREIPKLLDFYEALKHHT